jgi:Mg-chelatase subunit ChlD
MNSTPYPKEYYCPITHELLKTPVIAKDGFTYEKEAIEEWFRTSTKSPMTNQNISKELLINYALKNSMETIVQGARVTTDSFSTQMKESYTIASKATLEARKYSVDDEDYLHVKVKSPDEGTPIETLIIGLIDISGSMGQSASIETDSGETHGFSRLDLVKHSLKTIINSVNENTSISLIKFSDTAQTVVDPIKMSSTQKSMTCDIVDSLRPTNTTNIWDALRLGLEIASNSEHANKNISILLFTDGVPNVNPPRGIINSLERSLTTNHPNCTINTFGFGYGLDSNLLRNISNIGYGTYSFIPDATMVGTIFVNFISNVLLTYDNNLTIEIAKLGGYCFEKINIGSVQYGQDKDFLIKIPKEDIKVKLNSHVIQFDSSPIYEPISEEFNYHYCRNKIITLLDTLLHKNMRATHQTISESISLIDHTYDELSAQFVGSERISKLLSDLKSISEDEGQILKAVSRLDWYEKWGKHYILSIQRAHELQICNNFKDPGVQLYGGKVFSTLRDIVEEIFCQITPPKPSIQSNSYGAAQNSVIAPVNMSTYMNASGGCFDGDSTIELSSGFVKRVKDLVKGDILLGNNKIVCIVKTKIDGKVEMVKYNNMLITPWHPIRINKEWVFPINVTCSMDYELDYIYNIVLDSGHICRINYIEVVTLGHNFTDNSVVQHDYYGSDKVIQDLMTMDGWDTGLVIMEKQLVNRRVSDGHVVSMSA